MLSSRINYHRRSEFTEKISHRHNDSLESNKKSGNASDFKKTISTRNKNLENFIPYLFSTKEENKYRLQFISLCHQLRNKKTNALHKFTEPKTATTSKSFNPQEEAENYSSALINCIESIKPDKNRQDDDTKKKTDVSSSSKNSTENINPTKYTTGDHTIKKMDNIYYWYIVEKTFGFHLLYTLYQNIEKVHSTSFFSFEDEYAQKTLAKFSKLPNSLTRTFICNSAFNYIDGKTNSYADYWSYRRFSQRKNIVTEQSENEQGFNFYKWLSQCNLFIDYLCDIVIPVYDWYMLITLLENIENQYPSYPSSETRHLEHLAIALDRIHAYITNTYPSPDSNDAFLDGNIGTADELSKTLYKIDINTIEKLHNTYYKDWDIELNIKPLTRDIFTKRNPEKSETYFEDIRNLYLEVLYLSPLNSV